MIKRFLAAIFICFFAVAPSFAAVSIIASAKNNAFADPDTVGVTVTHGFTLQNDDVLYAFVAQGDDLGTTFVSSSGGEWTQLAFNASPSGNDRAFGVLRRVVTNAAGEPSSYQFTMSGNTGGSDPFAAVVVQVRGADTTTPEDATTTVANVMDDFTPANVTITTVSSDVLVLIAHEAAGLVDTMSTKTTGVPSGWSLVNSELFANGVNATEQLVTVASKTQASPDTVTPGSWTGTPDDAINDGTTVAVAIKAAVTTGAVLIGNQPKFLD